MTIAQQQRLDDLYADYLSKKAAYDVELIDNYKAHNGQESFPGQAELSDVSLATKKVAMNNALSAYNAYKEDIAAQERAAFAAANPNAAIEISKAEAEADANAAIGISKAEAEAKANAAIAISKAEAEAAAAKANAELAAQNASFAAKNKQVILYAGVVLVVIVVGVFIYLKVKKAA